MGHDFAAQKAETFAVYHDLQAKHGLPDVADIDYFFISGGDTPDWDALAQQLSALDFECAFVEGDDGGAPYLVATLPEQAVSASSIWLGEEIATQTALALGFLPDGWGMES